MIFVSFSARMNLVSTLSAPNGVVSMSPVGDWGRVREREERMLELESPRSVDSVRCCWAAIVSESISLINGLSWSFSGRGIGTSTVEAIDVECSSVSGSGFSVSSLGPSDAVRMEAEEDEARNASFRTSVSSSSALVEIRT